MWYFKKNATIDNLQKNAKRNFKKLHRLLSLGNDLHYEDKFRPVLLELWNMSLKRLKFIISILARGSKHTQLHSSRVSVVALNGAAARNYKGGLLIICSCVLSSDKLDLQAFNAPLDSIFMLVYHQIAK